MSFDVAWVFVISMLLSMIHCLDSRKHNSYLNILLPAFFEWINWNPHMAYVRKTRLILAGEMARYNDSNNNDNLHINFFNT